jgi:hypothetical protein
VYGVNEAIDLTGAKLHLDDGQASSNPKGRVADVPVVKDGVFPYMGSFRAGFEDPPLQTNLSISRKVWKLLSRRCV